MAELDRNERLALLDYDTLDDALGVADAVGEPQALQMSQAKTAQRSADAFTRIADALERLATTAEAREARESGA